jgi:hypothetical protein
MFQKFLNESTILCLKNSKESDIITKEVAVVVKYYETEKILIRPSQYILVNLQLIKKQYIRDKIIGQIASAQNHCSKLFVTLIIHPKYLKISNSGIVLLGVGKKDPDDRFLPAELYCCEDRTRENRTSSWAIGCVLHKMLMGYAPVENNAKRFESIAKCLGSPTITECDALKLPYSLSLKKRLPRHFSCATSKERKIIKKCLSWNPDSYMICTNKGLVEKIDTIYELEE